MRTWLQTPTLHAALLCCLTLPYIIMLPCNAALSQQCGLMLPPNAALIVSLLVNQPVHGLCSMPQSHNKPP
jgi:hypothetical protein